MKKSVNWTGTWRNSMETTSVRYCDRRQLIVSICYHIISWLLMHFVYIIVNFGISLV